MRPHNTSSKAGDTAAEYDPTTACGFHGWDAKLGKKECRSTISSPSGFEVFYADLVDRFELMLAECSASVVVKDGRFAHLVLHFLV